MPGFSSSSSERQASARERAAGEGERSANNGRLGAMPQPHERKEYNGSKARAQDSALGLDGSVNDNTALINLTVRISPTVNSLITHCKLETHHGSDRTRATAHSHICGIWWVRSRGLGGRPAHLLPHTRLRSRGRRGHEALATTLLPLTHAGAVQRLTWAKGPQPEIAATGPAYRRGPGVDVGRRPSVTTLLPQSRSSSRLGSDVGCNPQPLP